jgi:asparagine synthase (glutamine-hydrolysing)
MLVGAGEYLRHLPESFSQIEEPIGTTSALATRYVSSLMSSSVVVGLSGQGADEPLGGYWRHVGVKLASTLSRIPLTRPGSSLLMQIAPNTRLERGLRTVSARTVSEMLIDAYCVLTPEQKSLLYSAQFANLAKDSVPGQVVESIRGQVSHLSPLDQMLYVDTRLWLPDELLLIADKLSMAASIELRVPFLDEDLISLVESMAPSQKVRGFSRKWIHKKAMLKWLPRRIVYRKERGWNTPMSAWLGNELLPLLRETLLSQGSLCRELLVEREVRRMIDDHCGVRRDYSRQLFCLLSLGLWHRSVQAWPQRSLAASASTA